ncbi:MAG: hypothetical protein RIQ81_1428 [Pseudomonadota bacterium]
MVKMTQPLASGVRGSALPLIILGSSSPRRRELLGHIVAHEVISPDIEEKPKKSELPEGYAERNAREKNAAVIQSLARRPVVDGQQFLIITCDTIVVLGDQILEKPADQADASRMLAELSGQTHTVVSGVSLTLLQAIAAGGTARDASLKPLNTKTFTVKTKVSIKPLTPAEIDAYVATGEPMDKAGSYAAQGIGAYMIERIDGSYSNVVGLPLTELVRAITIDFSVSLW